MKVHNLAPSVFAFLHALANAGELKSTDRFEQLIKLAKSEQARSRCAILDNSRSESHFLAIARFLKTMKKKIWPEFFCNFRR